MDDREKIEVALELDRIEREFRLRRTLGMLLEDLRIIRPITYARYYGKFNRRWIDDEEAISGK